MLKDFESENLSIEQKCIIFDDLFDRTTLSKKVVSSLYDNFLHGKCI